MECQPQRKCDEDHVHQTDIQDSLRVAMGPPRIGEQPDRGHHAHGGDRVAHHPFQPASLIDLHGVQREAVQGGANAPQPGDDERHDAQASGSLPKEIVREGSWATTCGAWVRGGRVRRGPYESRDPDHSSGQCTVKGNHRGHHQAITNGTIG
jgi:hypothetical protein